MSSRFKPTSAAAVYHWLRPFAEAQGTLIPATELEFRGLCDLVIIQRRLRDTLLTRRMDDRWRQFARTYDLVTRRVEVKLRSFRLAPLGAPMIPAEKKPQTTLEALKARRQGLHVATCEGTKGIDPA